MAFGSTSSFSRSFRAGDRPLTITTATQLPSLNLWYNASTTTTTVSGVVTNNFDVTVSNGTAIGKWKDLTGLGQDANVFGGASNKPTYSTPIQNGLGAVLYNSANSSNLDINPLNAWAQNLSGLTIFVVARPTSLPASVFPLAVSDTSLGIWWNGTNWSVEQSLNNSGSATVTNNTSAFHIYGMVFDGTQTGNANRLKFRYDKNDVTLSFTGTIGTTTGTPGYLFFGGDDRNTPALYTKKYMDGYIGEILIWTRALMPSEYLAAEVYLSNKWGM